MPSSRPTCWLARGLGHTVVTATCGSQVLLKHLAGVHAAQAQRPQCRPSSVVGAGCRHFHKGDNCANAPLTSVSGSVRLIVHSAGQLAAVNQYGAWLLHFRCMPTDGICHLRAAACSRLCRYYGMKQQLLESFGFGPDERFPVYPDRFPIQLLSYLRLSRIQDPGLFAKVGRLNT